MDELHALLGSSMPDHHLCVVGSLGALPASVPRSLAAWAPPPRLYRAATPDNDLEAGAHFTFHPCDDSEEEEAEKVEGVEEAVVEVAQQEAAEAAQPAATLEEPPAALPGCSAEDALAEPSRQPSEAARWVDPVSAADLGYCAGCARPACPPQPSARSPGSAAQLWFLPLQASS